MALSTIIKHPNGSQAPRSDLRGFDYRAKYSIAAFHIVTYTNIWYVQELTREMCLELIEYINLDAYVDGQPRDIYIYYKLLDEPLKDKRSLF